MNKKKLPYEKFWMKKNNIISRLYETEDGTRLPIRPLEGNVPRLVATTNKSDRAFLGENVISTTQNV